MAVNITLEDDEALVLFEVLSSGRLEPPGQAERKALWRLECLLQKELVAPYSVDWSQILDAARASLIARYGE
jgi:hypothetical protein